MKLKELNEKELTELYEMIKSYRSVDDFIEQLQYALIVKLDESLNKIKKEKYDTN